MGGWTGEQECSWGGAIQEEIAGEARDDPRLAAGPPITRHALRVTIPSARSGGGKSAEDEPMAEMGQGMSRP